MGSTGAQGQTGNPGPVGGSTGPTGSKGNVGATGANGNTGPSGNNGINGVTGPTGVQGPTGIAGYIDALSDGSTQGTRNVFLGNGAGQNINNGYENTAIGYDALNSNFSGAFNTANGAKALNKNTSGNDNTATGSFALYSNTTSGGNTANGKMALYLNTSGAVNTATGGYTLMNNIDGNSNTANGYYAMFANTSGDNNTASGKNALRKNTIGGGNTANGANALYNNIDGATNTAIGISALYENTAGNYNTANGSSALNKNTVGNYNTAIGSSALYGNTAGNYNTAIGNLAGRNSVGDSSIFIGNRAGYYETGNSKLHIANTQNKTLIYGDFANDSVIVNGTFIATENIGIGTHSPERKLEIEGDNDYVGLRLNNTGTDGDNWDILSISGSGLSPGGLTFWNGDHKMLIDKDGKVGIGSSTPHSRLTINGDLGDIHGGIELVNGGTSQAGSGDNWYIYQTTNKGLAIRDDAINRLWISENGNIGINTSTPGAKLDVNGGLKASSFIGDGSALTNLPTSNDEIAYPVDIWSFRSNDPNAGISMEGVYTTQTSGDKHLDFNIVVPTKNISKTKSFKLTKVKISRQSDPGISTVGHRWWNKHIYEIDSDGNSTQVGYTNTGTLGYADDSLWDFIDITLVENKRYVLRIWVSANSGADAAQNAITDITVYGKWE
jgi:hypothetical protein